MKKAHVYTYDVKCFAIVKIYAPSENDAERAAFAAIEELKVFEPFDHSPTVRISDVSLSVDDEGGPYLTEIDGRPTDEDHDDDDEAVDEPVR